MVLRQAAEAVFVMVAEGFSPAAAGWRTTRTAGLKPSAGNTKPFGLEMRRVKACITPRVGGATREQRVPVPQRQKEGLDVHRSKQDDDPSLV
jgi:hypothetical protein